MLAVSLCRLKTVPVEATPQQLEETTQKLIDAARKRPELSRLFSTFRANVPQLYVDVDRVKAKKENVSAHRCFPGPASLSGRILYQ